MLFDAGIWGVVEVDEIHHEENYVVGVKDPGDYFHEIAYFQYGEKLGCTRRISMPADDLSHEAAKKNIAHIMRVCNNVINRLDQEEFERTHTA